MRIVCLAWGSLIWKPQPLELAIVEIDCVQLVLHTKRDACLRECLVVGAFHAEPPDRRHRPHVCQHGVQPTQLNR